MPEGDGEPAEEDVVAAETSSESTTLRLPGYSSNSVCLQHEGVSFVFLLSALLPMSLKHCETNVFWQLAFASVRKW